MAELRILKFGGMKLGEFVAPVWKMMAGRAYRIDVNTYYR
jgi:hypothetical protein